MMWRAFVPATSEEQVHDLPAWFVSFDNEHFVEVSKKPDPANASMLEVGWRVAIFGPKRMRRGQRRVQLLPPMIVTVAMLRKVTEIEEVPV